VAGLISELENPDIEIVGFLEASRVWKEGRHSPCFFGIYVVDENMD
jgi:hypothetical protein